MPLILETIPCLADNYAYLIHDPITGETALVDAPESAPILAALAEKGYDLPPMDGLSDGLLAQTQSWPIADYLCALSRLPQSLQDAVSTAWGAPEDDPLAKGAAFHFPAIRAILLNIVVLPSLLLMN